MLLGQGLFALRMLLFSSMLALASPSYAYQGSLDSKAKALAHYIMAVCDDLNGDSAQAISEYQQSVKYNGLEAAPRIKLGAYYLRLDQTAEAIDQLKAVVRISPQGSLDPDVYMYLGQLYYAQQQFPKAIEQFLKIVRLRPDDPSALYLLGSVYADSNDNPKAMGLFRKVLNIDPQNSEALNSLGYVYAQQGIHLDEAVRMIRQAIEIDPTNGAYYDSLGWALYKKGMYLDSLIALEKAGTFIEDEILYDHIGDVYKALKRYTQACAYWRKSFDLDPHQVLVQQKIKALEKWIASQSFHRLN